MYYTYILYSIVSDRYVGHCGDINARLLRHNNKMVQYTKHYAPWKIVYREMYETRSEANQRELYIKKMKSRKFIELLIMSKSPNF